MHVGTNESHVDNLQLIRNRCDQPVLVTLDIEDRASVLQNAGASVVSLDIRCLRPTRIRRFLEL